MALTGKARSAPIACSDEDRYFFSGTTCAFFEIAIDKYTDLRFNPDEWDSPTQ